VADELVSVGERRRCRTTGAVVVESSLTVCLDWNRGSLRSKSKHSVIVVVPASCLLHSPNHLSCSRFVMGSKRHSPTPLRRRCWTLFSDISSSNYSCYLLRCLNINDPARCRRPSAAARSKRALNCLFVAQTSSTQILFSTCSSPTKK